MKFENPIVQRRLKKYALISFTIGLWLAITALSFRAVDQNLRQIREGVDRLHQRVENINAKLPPGDTERPESDNVPPTAKTSTRTQFRGSGNVVEVTIRRIAEEKGYANVDFLVAVARCESGLRPNALGDGHYRSRGVWQISAYHHPTISDEQAYSVEWSTNWAVDQFLAGRSSLWTCARKLG